jgi:hypothetical protein
MGYFKITIHWLTRFAQSVWQALLHGNGRIKGRAVSDSGDIAFQMGHIIRNTAESITHKTGMPEHNVRTRKITD